MKPIQGVINEWEIVGGSRPRVTGVLFQAPGIPARGIVTSLVKGRVETPFGKGVETLNSIYILGSYGGKDE